MATDPGGTRGVHETSDQKKSKRLGSSEIQRLMGMFYSQDSTHWSGLVKVEARNDGAFSQKSLVKKCQAQ